MDSISEARKKIAVEKARLEAREKRLKSKERKIRIAELIKFGEVVEASGIDLPSQALLGLLLEARGKKDAFFKKWAEAGELFLRKQKQDRGSPMIISFKSDQDQEVREILRSRGFKWNRFRREWQGYGEREDIIELVGNFSPKIELVSNG